MSISITPEERRLARHAMGLSNPSSNGVAYRNRFMAGTLSENADTWRGLALRGLALVNDQGGTLWAHCGSKLAYAVLEVGEHIDREETQTLANIDLVLSPERDGDRTASPNESQLVNQNEQ